MSTVVAEALPRKLLAESRITAPPGSVTELLSLDHRCLDAVLAEAKRCLFAGDLGAGAAAFASFRDGLEHHIAAEEEILFPALDALRGGAAAGPLHVMRTEHADIRQLMAEVAASLERGAGDGPTAPLAALTARLYAHNGKEERILYPMSDQAVGDAAARENLVGRIRAF